MSIKNSKYGTYCTPADDKMNIEIAERTTKGNKAHCANAKRMKSEFLTKNTKKEIYKTMIRPVVRYLSETWALAAKDENSLRIFERQILRKIFGALNTDIIWRIRNSMEIDKLIEGAERVRFIKAQRIKWLGHVQRMDQARPARKLLDCKPMGIRPVGRQILRKICGPVNIDNIWRIRNNMEIDKPIEGADIVGFIKAQRIK